jgi:mannosyltransferase OCH1-like enzyme
MYVYYIMSINEDNTNTRIIPKIIYQTWHSKRIPIRMYNSIIRLQKHNPEFKYCLYSDDECREFILKWYDGNVLNAFDKLIPGAYKADLWRYCILYKLGGVYIDIKYTSINGNKLIHLLDKEHFVMDCDKKGIYNAFIICKPGNRLLLDCIYQIVLNVQNNYFGPSALHPTGPKLLYKQMLTYKDFSINIDMTHHYNDKGDKFVSFNNAPILKTYDGFKSDRDNCTKTPHYGTLWINRTIYKT